MPIGRQAIIWTTDGRLYWRIYALLTFVALTHWGREKIAAIFQTTFSNAFSWMKMFKFRLRFLWSLFPRVQLTIFQHWFRYWLGAGQATSHYLNQWWLVYWRMYVSLGLNELNYAFDFVLVCFVVIALSDLITSVYWFPPICQGGIGEMVLLPSW